MEQGEKGSGLGLVRGGLSWSKMAKEGGSWWLQLGKEEGRKEEESRSWRVEKRKGTEARRSAFLTRVRWSEVAETGGGRWCYDFRGGGK